MKYDVIVVGGGHAGCEAAHAAAILGFKVALITANIKNIADMPCNPSIGGTAKGIVVREIDALGGLMGKVADRSHIQIKMLNNAKGPAVRSLRAQADKITYPQEMIKELKNLANLTIIEAMVEKIEVIHKKVAGIRLANNTRISCKSLILTTGTYLKSKILVGSQHKWEGPHGEESAKHLSDSLKSLGFNIIRLKTGTPQRIDKKTVDFTKLKAETGDLIPLTFSFDNKALYNINDQVPCYVTYTNEKTHKIIRDNLKESAMYGGYAEGVGARYCPSIEDKVVRFADKERHQLFLEPESIYYDDLYLQGFSTSMPHDIQEQMVHSLPGLENAKILKYAYAIEYDAIDPLQLKASLETKIIENLFTAGQINGTSGYEEAACQGLIAGINVALKLKKRPPLILKRNEAYIGVLIDDLVTKGTFEPYRLLTSRAEFRLILRHDNADLRLREYGYQVGLIDDERYQKLLSKKTAIEKLLKELKTLKISPKNISREIKTKISNREMSTIYSLYDFLKRPEIKIGDYVQAKYISKKIEGDILEQVEFFIKYEGYIKKTYKDVEKLLKLEAKKIPDDIDYSKVINLASEARQKLNLIKPKTIAQAARISGVNSVDLSMLAIYLKREYPNE